MLGPLSELLRGFTPCLEENTHDRLRSHRYTLDLHGPGCTRRYRHSFSGGFHLLRRLYRQQGEWLGVSQPGPHDCPGGGNGEENEGDQ